MDTIRPLSKKERPVSGDGNVTTATKWALGLITLLILVFLCGRLNLYLRFSGDVARLLANGSDVSGRKFSYRQLEGLPQPVQQYFTHVLRPGQSYISSVHLLHTGLFKTELKKGWVAISGEEYFTAHRPGFVWKGRRPPSQHAICSWMVKGGLWCTCFLFFKYRTATGRNSTGELMRWLGESVCFPTNLLPSKDLQWYPVDDQSARLEYSYQGMLISLMVKFNAAHEIEQMTAMRNMGEGPRQKWVTRLSEYQLRDGIRIPTVLEAAWDLPEGYSPYARFVITEIEYNRAL